MLPRLSAGGYARFSVVGSEGESEMLRHLDARDFEEGSLGAWLKKAVEEERTRQQAANVVDIESKRRPPQ